MTTYSFDTLTEAGRVYAAQAVARELEWGENVPLVWEPGWPSVQVDMAAEYPPGAQFGENGAGETRLELCLLLRHDDKVMQVHVGDYDGATIYVDGNEVTADSVLQELGYAIGVVDDDGEWKGGIDPDEFYEGLAELHKRFMSIYDGALWFAQRAVAPLAATTAVRQLPTVAVVDGVIDFDEVVRILATHGVASYVEQTGGGCATIFAGPIDTPSRWGDDTMVHRVAAGPGWFDAPGWKAPRGHVDELCVGPNDQGESDPYSCTRDDTAETVAARIIQCINDPEAFAAAVTEAANKQGATS